MADPERADKWLWSTRFYKTRVEAASACTAGNVRRGSILLKPSSLIRPNDQLQIDFAEGPGQREIRVISLVPKRVGPSIARTCFEDLTAPETYANHKQWMIAKYDSKGGRPTKRNRREIDRIHGFWDAD